jgi:hypothetical protein
VEAQKKPPYAGSRQKNPNRFPNIEAVMHMKKRTKRTSCSFTELFDSDHKIHPIPESIGAAEPSQHFSFYISNLCTLMAVNYLTAQIVMAPLLTGNRLISLNNLLKPATNAIIILAISAKLS